MKNQFQNKINVLEYEFRTEMLIQLSLKDIFVAGKYCNEYSTDIYIFFRLLWNIL